MKFTGIAVKILVTAIFSLALFLGGEPVFAENYVGIILSGYEKGCEVVHQGKTFECGDRRELYVGDIITKKPSARTLKIRWAPYVNGAIRDETSMEVAWSQPEKFKSNTYVAALKQYIDDFVKPTQYTAIAVVTRGGGPKMRLPSRATLMQGYPIEIAGSGGEIRSITVFDTKGQKVYETLVTSKDPVSLIPEEIGIKPLESYTVHINEGTKTRKLDILLMDGTTQEEVVKGLADIDSTNVPKQDNLIEKVSYLQLISDAYPDKIDLYWLGYQLLQENKYQFTKDQEIVIQGLMQRHNSHYRDKVS